MSSLSVCSKERKEIMESPLEIGTTNTKKTSWEITVLIGKVKKYKNLLQFTVSWWERFYLKCGLTSSP